jgi:hypothetical protein
MTTLNAALTVAASYPVFPCGRNKRPYFSNKELEQLFDRKIGRGQGGCKVASQDPEIVKALWQPNPQALVGVHTASLVCVDWDTYKAEDAAAEWIDEHMPQLEAARIHGTKSGGQHFIFRLPPGVKLPPKIDGIDSIDIKAGLGSYIIWPTDGSGYEVRQNVEPPLLPQDLIDAIGARYEADAPSRDWTPNDATDAELEAAVLSGGDYHAALASLTMRWANRLRPDGARPDQEVLLDRAVQLLRQSKPNQQDRVQRRDDLIADVGGELSRLCSGAWEKANPPDPFQGVAELLSKRARGDEDDPFAGLDLSCSPFFTGDPTTPPEEGQKKREPIDIPQRRVLSGPEEKPAPRQWLHGRYLITGHMTMTAAPGGTGKSTAVMTELLEIACQQDVTGQRLWRPAKVLYINGEDPVDEIERRLYACILKHGFDRGLIAERFWYFSGRDFDGGLHFVESDGYDVQANEAAIEALETLIDDSGAEIVCIDPLSSFHGVNENSNSEVRTLMDALRGVSHRKSVSFHMVHHSVKEAIQNKTLGAEGARGASAFLDACRIVRTLRTLTKEENKRAGLPEGDKSVVRTVIGKGNMTQAGDGTFMFRLQGVDLQNGDETYPEGDNVGVIEAYDANIEADSFDDLGRQADAARVLLELADGEYRVYPGSGPRHNQWLGHFMMKDLGVEIVADMDAALSLLEAEGFLRIERRRDAKKGRDFAVYVVDKDMCRRVIEVLG